MSDEPTLAQALVALKAHLAVWQAIGMVVEAVEAAGDVAGMVRELEQERDLLEIEVATVKRERERGAGGPGEGGATMTVQEAGKKAAELTMAQAEKPTYSRIEVQPIDPNGDPAKGFKVVGRDMRDFSKFHELGR